MIDIEVVQRDVTHPKLTIANSRTTLKLPHSDDKLIAVETGRY